MIAELMRKRLPNADIVGVGTEEEVLGNLTDVLAPFTVTVSDSSSSFEQQLGCFVQGAGKMGGGRKTAVTLHVCHYLRYCF